jgi:exosome complex component RRP42
LHSAQIESLTDNPRVTITIPIIYHPLNTRLIPRKMTFKALSKSEKSYIQSSLQAQSPLRADGRSLHQFRAITLQTGVVPIANGSAHLNLGRSSDEGIGGTEVLAAAKLEAEDIVGVGSGSSSTTGGVEGGRIVCTVSWCVASTFIHPPLPSSPSSRPV